MHLITLASNLPPLWRWSTKWGYFIGLAALIGSLLSYVIVVRPALRAHAEPDDLARGTRMMHRLIGAAPLLMLLVLAPQNAAGAARGLKIDFWSGFTWHNQVSRYLLASPKKGAWMGAGVPTLIQLVVVLVLAIALVPLLWRRSDTPATERLITTMAPLAVLATLVKAVPVGHDDLEAQELLGTLLTQVHIVAGCTWAGGLLGMCMLVRSQRGSGRSVVDTWTAIWNRFGAMALVSVGAIAISGTFLAWREVGSLSQMVTTTYGIVLTCKLALVALLVVAGAINQFVLMPRAARLRAAGNTQGAFQVVIHQFGRVVAAESIAVVLVVLGAALLTGSARAQAGHPGEPHLTAHLVMLGLGILAALALLLWGTAKVSDRLAARVAA